MAAAPRPAGVRRRAGTGQNTQPQRSASWPTDQRSTCRLVRYPPIHKAGRLWTVNWHALLNKPDILFRNERHINILDTANFGRMGFVEIGALSVGRIVQVHGVDAPYTRGQEKSVFRFGGSAIAVFGEPGRWRPTADLLENTAKGIETLLRLGEPAASRE